MATRFSDTASTALSAANLNSLDRGGNVSVNAAGGLSVDISACRIVKAASASTVDYAGASAQAVTDNTTNYVYLDATGALVINTTGFPASYATTPFCPLATVVTSGGVCTSVTDKRPNFWLP